MLSAVKGWTGRPLFGWQGINIVDALLATVLSIWAVCLTSGVGQASDPQGGFWAGLAVLTMTVPVLWRRRAAFAAIATLAAGAALNAIVIGSFVRCGATLPALALCVFSVGLRCERRPALMGAGLGLVSVVCQGQSDPRLASGFVVPGSVLILLLWGTGRLVRSRERMVVSLRARTAELGEQRERNAHLAVSAERARIAAGVDGLLHERIGALATQAANGRAAVDGDQPDLARENLSTIEHDGRQTLGQMREIVGALHDDGGVEPQPGLDDLDGLLARATTSDVRLTVDGERRGLPAGLELSGYRIVEHLLHTVQDTPDARVDVRLTFASDALEIGVAGPARAGVDSETALAGAREWVALRGGRLETGARGRRAQTVVRLPLVTAYA